jgi:hypothetical protein
MSQFGEMMRRARQDAQEGDWSPPPGVHKAVVVEGDAFESNAGDAYAKTTLRLVAPGSDDDGRQWDHLMGFRSPQQAQMSAAQLSLYGLSDEQLDNLEDIDDLAAHMAELAGVEVEVSCKSRANGDGVWTNVTSSRGHGGSDVSADQTELEVGAAGDPPRPRHDTHPDDDVPF